MSKIKPVVIDGDLTIGDKKTVIIAEVGLNHNGDIFLAKQMISSAWENGADLIKLQSFATNKFFKDDLPYFDETVRLELTLTDQQNLFSFAKEKGIRLFTTFFDLDTLDEFDLPLYKVASMDLNNYQLISRIAKRQKPVIISTGMAVLDEIDQAVRVMKNAKNNQIVLLHCVSDYPTAPGDLNLKYMHFLRNRYNLPCGISEHTIGMDAAFLSVGMGAAVIEKHFTIDKGLQEKNPEADHTVSMDPAELKTLSKLVKNAVVMFGRGEEKILTPNEQKGRDSFRRGIYAAADIGKGEMISEESLIMLRPVRGLRVSSLNEIIGKQAVRQIRKGDPLKSCDYEP